MKRLKMDVQPKMMVSSEKARKVKKERKLPFGVCGDVVGSNAILCRFFSCWVHKRCSLNIGFP